MRQAGQGDPLDATITYRQVVVPWSDDLPEEFRGEEVTSRLQTAEHLILGFEADLPFHLTLNIEGYYTYPISNS